MSNKTSITKNKKAPVWVWFLSLVPVLSTVLFVLMLGDFIPVNFEEVNAVGTLVFILAIAIWGACGFLFGYFRAKMLTAVLAANAFPLLCAAVYTVCIVGALFGAASLADTGILAALGMGLFSYIDTVIFSFFPQIGYFGLYVDLVFIVFTFVVGFTMGKTKKIGA